LGYIKDAAYEPPMATAFPELAAKISDALATFTLNFLNNLWNEPEYGYIVWATHNVLTEQL
jgi:hypothetical protein